MPPGNAHTGDVLDRALHVARTQAASNPNLTKPQAGFFGAVAGKGQPGFQQSSRIAHPFATNTFLGGGTTPTVSTPEQQAFISKGAAQAGNPQARTIEQNYVKAADTQKTIPARKTAGVRGGPTGVQGAALTAPNIQAVGTRALGLLGSGIPLGSAAPAAIQALGKLGLPTDQRQQVIGGFSRDPTLDAPGTKEALTALAMLRGNGIPAHPTTRQLLTAALTPNEHKPSWGDAINPFNIAKDALYTPVYAAEGGYALGHASRQAVQGNPSELEAIGKSQLQQLEHPGAFAQEHPFQAALTLASGFKGAGALAGKAAGLEAADRVVPATAFGDVPIPRNELSTNLTTRLGQKASDLALGNSKRMQSNALKGETRKIANTVRIEQNHQLSAAMKPLAQAAKGISRRRQASLLYNEAQGATAPEFAQMYRDLAAEHGLPTQEAQANLRTAQGERFPGPANEKEQAYVDAARHAANIRTQMLLSMKTPAGTAALDPLSAQWRDYQHLVGLRASQGDPLAQAVAQARTNAVATLPGTAEHEAANGELAKSLDAFAKSTDAQPFRVPTVKPKLRSEFNYPGRSLRAKIDPSTMVSGLRNSTGAALESGNYPHDPANFYRELQQPHTAAAAIEYTNRVSKELGRPAVPNEPIPEGMVLRNVENLRTTPKTTITATDSLNHEATALQSLQDEFVDPAVADITHVPATGKFLLIPKPVYDQITQNVARVNPKGLEAGLSKATRAYKTGILMTRPAYPASNFVNSLGQSALGGAGPLSFARRNALPLPPGVEDAGFIASEFRKSGRLGFRSGLDQAAVTPNALGKVEAVGKGAARFVGEQYLERIRKYSVQADNVWRKALYVNKALPEARKLAYPDDGAIKRLLVRRKASDAAIQDAAKQMAEGATPEAKRAAARALKTTNDFLNDFGAMQHYKTLDLAVPFNSWTRFSAKLLLKTLPLNYPGRTALLYRLGQIGQQGANQQGVLPSYLQESIPLSGSPAAQWLTNTQRANSFATLGTTFPPDQTTGVPDYSQVIGNLSPALPLIVNPLTGTDIQSVGPNGPRVLRNAQGKPIKGNLGDMARYEAGQVASFLPPLGVATGGTRGKADTSIPIPGLTQNAKPSASTPAYMRQPSQPWWLPIVNTIAPIRFDVRNQHADQLKGMKLLHSALIAQQKAEIQSEAKTPADATRIEAKYQELGAKVAARSAYYLKNPKALAAVLDAGSGGR